MKQALLILACLALAASLSLAVPQQADGTKRIEITAKRYTFTPAEITLTKGQPVTLVLTSEDVTHGWTIPELGVKAEIPKGETTEVTITPEKAGTFEAQCAYFCGPGHGTMKMTVHVTE